MTQLINSIYETGKWSKDFTGYKDCLKVEAISYEMQRSSYNQHHSTYSKDDGNDAKRKDGKENQGCTWRDKFELRRGNRTRYVNGILGITTE